MKRLLKHKFFKLAFGALILVPLTLAISSSSVRAAVGPGCYADFSGAQATCPTNSTNDIEGNAVDGTKKCYIVSTGSNQQTEYQKVGCMSIGTTTSSNYCGGPGQEVPTAIALGCTHRGNPILDLLFAIIRLLSAGVGIVVVASVIVAGVQFSTARSDPQAVGSAIGRVRASVVALLIYIFAYAILNFLIPGGFFTNSSTPSNNSSTPSNNSST